MLKVSTQRLLAATCCALIALTAGAAHGQDDPTNGLQKRVDGFFATLTASGADPKAAFDELLAGGPLEKSDDVKKLSDEVRKFDDKYGAFVEVEQVSARRVGKDLVLLHYLYKGQKFPVAWHFAFYRAPNKSGAPRSWTVVSLRFDTRFELLGH